MKIIDRKTFLTLPSGVLYMPFEPCAFGQLAIKESTVGNDFLVQNLDAVRAIGDKDEIDILHEAMESARSFELDFNCLGRDGMFDDSQLFAIFEPDDVIALIRRLSMLIPMAEYLKCDE